MCYFVTLGIASRHRPAIEAIGREPGGFSVHPATNPSVRRLFPKEDALFVLTHGGCSCDLYAEPQRTTAEEDEARGRARYQRRGWSEAKISRALEAKRNARGGRGGSSLAKFCNIVAALVHDAGRVRLFAHEYNARIDIEEVGPCAGLRVPLAEFKRQGGTFAVDAVVEIVR